MDSFRNIPDFGSASWKDPVDTQFLLPTVGNGAGDARVVKSLNTIFIWSGSAWVQVGGGSGVVVSVNGQTGVVVLTTDDIGEGPNNKYFTNARAVSAVGVSLIDSSTIDFTYNSSASEISAVIVDGSITNVKINSAAAIAYTKLNLANSIVDGDVSPTAAINRTKLEALNPDYVVVNDSSGVMSEVEFLEIAQGGTGSNNKSGAFDSLAPTSTIGDLIAHNGTSNVVLSPGADGLVLTADSAEPEGLTYRLANAGPLTGFTPLSGPVTASDSILSGIQKLYGNSQEVFNKNVIFGNGQDGNITISSGTVTLTQDAFYNNLTVSGTGALTTNAYRVHVANVLDISAAPVNAIRAVTTNAPNASGTSAGAQPGVLTSAELNTGIRGVLGAGGGVAAGGNGTAASATNVLIPPTNLGGRGGAGGAGASGVGGSQGVTNVSSNFKPAYNYNPYLLRGAILGAGGPAGSGAGGGGGDASAGGGGAGSGSGGGVVFIAARTINRGASTAVGAISALGGNGGNGGSSVAGNRGGGGGGGGGCGGYIQLVYSFLTGSTATDCIDVSGGRGGNGGNGFGTGIGGNGGGGGAGGVAVVINIVQGTTGVTIGPVATLQVPAVGTVGGTGNNGAVARVSL